METENQRNCRSVICVLFLPMWQDISSPHLVLWWIMRTLFSLHLALSLIHIYVEGLNVNGTENLEYCVEQGKNNVGGYREMAYAELKETISLSLIHI